MAYESVKYEELRKKTLYAAARLFLEKGYSNSTTREIAQKAGVNVSAMNRAYKSKENILCEIVQYVLKGQFQFTKNLLAGITDDKILYYAAETTLQLHMAESNEYVRELYSAAYSMPNSSDYIRNAITDWLADILNEYFPDYETKDFYLMEIASGGIMRGFMTVPCNIWFTMDQKVEAFLRSVFHVYQIPEEKISEAIEFVSRFDYPKIADTIIKDLLKRLE